MSRLEQLVDELQHRLDDITLQNREYVDFIELIGLETEYEAFCLSHINQHKHEASEVRKCKIKR